MGKNCIFCGKTVKDIQAHVRGGLCKEIPLLHSPLVMGKTKRDSAVNELSQTKRKEGDETQKKEPVNSRASSATESLPQRTS